MEQLMFPEGDRKSYSVSACAVAGRAIVAATVAVTMSASFVIVVGFNSCPSF